MALLMVGAVVFAPLSSAQLSGSATVVKASGLTASEAIAPGQKFKIAVQLDIAEGYHINGHFPSEDYLVATNWKLEPVAGLRFAAPQYEKPKLQKFEFSDKELAVLEKRSFIVVDVEADAALQAGAQVIKGIVTTQACNDKFCLAPADIAVEIPLRFVAAPPASTAASTNAPAIFANEIAAMQIDDGSVGTAATIALTEFGGGKPNDIAASLEKYGLLTTLLVIFWAGVLLNLTPCVYPIIPITIGFFANQGGGGAAGKTNLKRTFAMSSLYVLGMAITYSVLGVIASLTGGLFGAALQSPYVLIGLALLMVAMALSMFGVYEFKLPESLNRLASGGGQSKSSFLTAIVMGLTMGIVAAPCIGPFVVALLAFVSQKGDPLFGFLLFFVLAVGLGFPYIFLGAFSGSLKALPRSGVWMVTVRKVFGLILIGMALYFLNPLMGKWSTYVFVAFFAASALYLLFFEAGRTKPAQFSWVLRGLGVAAAGLAVFFAIPTKAGESIKWQGYSEQAIAEARQQGKGVIIDAYADWCIPCKELDQLTFTDDAVRGEAERFVTLKLDLTSNDPNTEAGRARSRYKIIGVPTILFLDAGGKEVANLRLEGFERPKDFLARMKGVTSAPAATELASNGGATGKPVADGAANASDQKGEMAPTVPLALLDGGKLELSSLKGKVLLVDFWATWCVPCISEIPMFNDLQKQYKTEGLEIVAVSLDEEGAQIVKPFLKKHPMNYTQTIGDTQVAESFKVTDVLPVAFLIDKQGRIRYTHTGVTKREVFEAQIKELLAEAP